MRGSGRAWTALFLRCAPWWKFVCVCGRLVGEVVRERTVK